MGLCVPSTTDVHDQHDGRHMHSRYSAVYEEAMSERFIAIDDAGTVEVHARSELFGYATLCGVDGNDSGQKTLPDLPKGMKLITCWQCFKLFEEANRFRRADFSIKLRVS